MEAVELGLELAFLAVTIYVTVYWAKRSERSKIKSAKRLLGLRTRNEAKKNLDKRWSIYVASRAEAFDDENVNSRYFTTAEDSLSMNFVERLISNAGWEGSIETRVIRHHQSIAQIGGRKNHIASICSPKANIISQEILEFVRKEYDLEINIEPCQSEPERWCLSVNGDKIESPSYEQERKISNLVASLDRDNPADMQRRDKLFVDAKYNDVAIIVRSRSPFDPSKKSLLVAGIRGVGTWGAAKYLWENYERIAQMENGPFCLVLDVTYENFRVDAKRIE